MSPKKKVNKAEAQKTEKTIQYVAIAMIVIVVAIVAWPYVAKLFPKSGAAAYNVASVGGCRKRNRMCGV